MRQQSTLHRGLCSVRLPDDDAEELLRREETTCAKRSGHVGEEVVLKVVVLDVVHGRLSCEVSHHYTCDRVGGRWRAESGDYHRGHHPIPLMPLGLQAAARFLTRSGEFAISSNSDDPARPSAPMLPVARRN